MAALPDAAAALHVEKKLSAAGTRAANTNMGAARVIESTAGIVQPGRI